MKKFLLLVAATAALCAAPAFAADTPVKAPPMTAAAPIFNWSGFYVGGTIGGVWVRDQLSDPPGGFVGSESTLDGVLGGPTVGFNLQTGSFLWGLEGDYSWTSVKDPISFGCTPACIEKVPYFATARLRGGYIAGSSLFYLTGGAAFTRIDLGQPGGPLGSFQSKDVTGWTVGAGWENAFAPNWSWKIEYLFADFGHPQDRPITIVVVRHDLSEHVVRFGLNYRFASDRWGKY